MPDAADICPVGSTNSGTDSVVVADAHASKTLATRQLRYDAIENPFAGLTLTADAVGWTEDGATHSAPLP